MDMYLVLGIPYDVREIVRVWNENCENEDLVQRLCNWIEQLQLQNKGTPKLDDILDFILVREDTGESIKRNVMLYMVVTFFNGNQQSYCTSIFLKNMTYVEVIQSYIWCQCTIDRVIDLTRKKKEKKCKIFEGLITFLLVR